MTQLIDANKAYFRGDRAAARRLIEEYKAANPVDFEQAQWINAHAQDEYDDFVKHMRLLIEHGQPDNRYVQMASEFLAEEYELEQQLAPPQRNNRRWLIGAGATGIIILLIAFGLPFITGNNSQEPVVVTATIDPLLITQPTEQLTDRSQTLFGTDYSARYTQGILQITAVEDRSQRVLSTREEQLIEPVPGARFVALSIVFECRSGICREPPEAELFLQLDNANLTGNRTDVYIEDSTRLEPVALGRTTGGWIIFEVPVLNRPTALVIRPFGDETGTRPADITIDLPVF